MSAKVRWMYIGLCAGVKKYKGFIINGFRFHIKKVEGKKRTQNYGVVLTVNTTSFASAKDKSSLKEISHIVKSFN